MKLAMCPVKVPSVCYSTQKSVRALLLCLALVFQVYGSMEVQIDSCEVSYSPGYEYAIAELFAAARRMMPRAVDPSPHMPYWDVLRHVLHVRLRVRALTALVTVAAARAPSSAMLIWAALCLFAG